METWRIAIPVVIFILCVIGVWYVIRLRVKEIRSRTYVYPKTEHTYLPIYRCKLKCPSTGEWFDAITYKGVEDKKYYVRERKDFFDKFVKLNNWKNGNKDK